MNYLKEMKSPERYRREIGIEDGRYMSSERNVTDRSMRVDVSEHARIQIVYTQDAKQVWELLGQNMSECRSFIRRNRSRIWVSLDRELCISGRRLRGKPLEVERYSNGGWEDADRLSHGNGAEDGR